MEDESAKLAKTRTILIGLPISDKLATEVIAKMLFLKSRNAHLPIQLFVNSPGGSVVAAVAILGTMDELRLTVRTHCLRICSGVAATVLAHGSTGMRSASPDSRISLSKVYVGNAMGRTSEQIDSEVEVATIALVTSMTKDSGQTEIHLRADMETERSFNAIEAKAYGLIDRIEAPTIHYT